MITPGSDPAEAFRRIRDVVAETKPEVLVAQIKRYRPGFPEPAATADPVISLQALKAELVGILTAENLGDVDAYGDTASRFDLKAGPLTGVRIGALGRVTAISASELSRTTADD